MSAIAMDYAGRIFETRDHGINPAGKEIKAEIDRTAVNDYVERVYKPNVRRLFELHKQKGEQVILVSQPARPSQFRREGSDVWVRDPNFAGYAVALSLVNNATAALCQERPRECQFIDLASDSDLKTTISTTTFIRRQLALDGSVNICRKD